MLEDSGRREFDLVVVWSLDRLSREGIRFFDGHNERQ